MRTVRLFVTGVFAMSIGSTSWAAACDGFTDVDSNSTYCSAVSYLKDKGITLGCTGSTYCPNAYVTRLQMALFLQRMGQGGGDNSLVDSTATVSGGVFNHADASYSTISGGTSNTASGEFSAVMGGTNNVASGISSAVIGASNRASGVGSVAVGVSANADQNYCMVLSFWGTANAMSCLGYDKIVRIGDLHGFSVDYYSQRPDGGGTRWVSIGDQISTQTIATWTGAFLSDAGVWVNASSSKASKTEFADVDAKDVLDKVAKMPITTWRYKQGEGAVRHMGPMAEDFWESFSVGYGPQTIADLDARGVALAAIQGLNAKVEAQARELAGIKAQLAAMAAAR